MRWYWGDGSTLKNLYFPKVTCSQSLVIIVLKANSLHFPACSKNPVHVTDLCEEIASNVFPSPNNCPHYVLLFVTRGYQIFHVLVLNSLTFARGTASIWYHSFKLCKEMARKVVLWRKLAKELCVDWNSSWNNPVLKQSCFPGVHLGFLHFINTAYSVVVYKFISYSENNHRFLDAYYCAAEQHRWQRKRQFYLWIKSQKEV